MRLAGDEGVRRTPAGLALDLPADAAPHLIRELVAAGVDVLEITPAERSLEEVFFEMTSPQLSSVPEMSSAEKEPVS